MEDNEVACVFFPAISKEEWHSVPSDVAVKLEKFVTSQFDELITSKALSETKRFSAEQGFTELQTQNESLTNENASLKARLEVATNTMGLLEGQLSKITAEFTNLQATCQRLESEAAEFRHQRNLAIDERDEHSKMVQRRNSELEMLNAEVDVLKKQLEAAVTAKCEALAQADEVASMKLTIEYREKRMEQERLLLNSHVESLTENLTQRTEELLNLRRDNSSRCIQLETKLTELQQEYAVATEQIKSLTELNNNYATRIEGLSEKLMSQREMEAKINESYLNEIEAKTKLANTYKSMLEESQRHSEELEAGLAEVQELLKNATEQYGELETKHKESELANDEIIAKKNEYIAMLKSEINQANELLETSKQDQMERDMEAISPSAVAASRLISGNGPSMTELYTQVRSLREELASKEQELTRLKNYVKLVSAEIEEKAPMVKRLRQDLVNANDDIDLLKSKNDSLFLEIKQMQQLLEESKQAEGYVKRENERLESRNVDLSRQLVHLLREIELAKNGSSSTSTDMEMSDSTTSADIITKRLVTFNDIADLQTTNQKLLMLVRELTDRQEEAEAMNPAAVAQIKDKLESLKESQQTLLEERSKQNKMIEILISQRDMYKSLYDGRHSGENAEEAAGEGTSNSSAMINGEAKTKEDAEIQNEEKILELEKEVAKRKQEIKQLKEENDTYRKEKTKNDQIIIEQLEQARGEIKELTTLNCRLTSQAEVQEERFKILQNNEKILKKQIEALENKTKIYSDSVIRHEQTISYLKDEVLQAQTRLSTAEVQVNHLDKENALLRDAESRHLKERESLKLDMHQQQLLRRNIELITANIERTDTEARLKMENRVDEANRECSSLRRRLQEEQDHFRELAKHLESETKKAQTRMEEEKAEADKLRKELNEVRENLIEKSRQVDDLTQKLKMPAYSLPESNADSHRTRELEQKLADSEAEIEALKSKLKASQETCEQYVNVSEAAEGQVKLLLEKQESQREEIEALNNAVSKYKEKCSELEAELSIRMDDQDMASSNIKSKSQQLQEELNTRTMNLNTARQQLELTRSENKSLLENLKAVENKYARQVVLHSTDLQKLTEIKEELTASLDQLNKVKQERDQALQELEGSKASWKKQEDLYNNSKKEIEQRFEDMEAQNSLLLDQIQALNTQLSILQTQSNTRDQNQSSESLNMSFTESDAKSSEQLLKIIKYLRQEKDLSINKCDILEAEHHRLKSQLEHANKQCEEMKATLDAERQKTEVAVVTAAKHSEVLRRVETLNAITDSNRSLRQERDDLLKQMEEYKSRTEQLEKDLAPLQEKTKELTIRAESLSSENGSLRADCQRWRQRATVLLEKTNRTSPEDWKKLQNERENLAKQLTIERSTTTKLNDEILTLKQDKSKLEDQLKSVRANNNSLCDELSRLKEELNTMQSHLSELTQSHETLQESGKKTLEENRMLAETIAAKDSEITELKKEVEELNKQIAELKNNNLTLKKIARKYKVMYDELDKEFKALKETHEQQTGESSKLTTEERSQFEERIQQIEQTHKDAIEQLNQQLVTSSDSFKKEFETLKQSGIDKEERFKTLFKNAKDRIMKLTDENNSLKEQLNKRRDEAATSGESSTDANLADCMARNKDLLKQNEDLVKEMQDSQNELEAVKREKDLLMQKVSKLQKAYVQQGAKPSTSSGSSEKPPSEPPTANIKPMAGHSTNTQTQSATVQPWRSGSEPPLASIRPMSAPLRTVAVLPTSQSPSAAIVPPQQQVHTTGSSNIEALSSSPTSSHTDYVPATSSASSMMGPRQVAVPPTQSSQDNEDEESSSQVQAAPQQQAVALVLPRVEPPSSGGPSQDQGTSSGGSNTVTTSQASTKRPREADGEGSQVDGDGKLQQAVKRTRLQAVGAVVSDSGVEVEYQVPTSSQRDHEDDGSVVVLDSDDEGGADEGEGADDEPDDPDAYDEAMDRNYEDAECQDAEEDDDDQDEEDEDETEGGNEVEVIEDSSEVPGQSGSQRNQQEGSEESGHQAQSEQISSGTDSGPATVTFSHASTSASSAARPRPPPYRHQQPQPLHLDEGPGDDSIVPSTPTLYVPRRSDGFGEAVASPLVHPSRFTFGDGAAVPEQTLEVTAHHLLDDSSTGRSVPNTPLHVSPQEGIPGTEDQGGTSSQGMQVDVDDPLAAGDASMPEDPPAGPSDDTKVPEEEMLEGDAEVSSEGEKPPAAEESMEEGREAEASPSTGTRFRNRGGQSSGMSMQPMSRPGYSGWGQRNVRQDNRRQNQYFPSRGNRRGQRSRPQRPF